jgi:hypothetical protein
VVFGGSTQHAEKTTVYYNDTAIKKRHLSCSELGGTVVTWDLDGAHRASLRKIQRPGHPYGVGGLLGSLKRASLRHVIQGENEVRKFIPDHNDSIVVMNGSLRGVFTALCHIKYRTPLVWLRSAQVLSVYDSWYLRLAGKRKTAVVGHTNLDAGAASVPLSFPFLGEVLFGVKGPP